MNSLFIITLTIAYLGASLATPVPPNKNNYDVGCFQQYRERSRTSHYYGTRKPLPQCMAGGLWRHYQCPHNTIFSSCICVYIDTGNSIPFHLQSHYYYYYQYFNRAACPILRERQPKLQECQKPPLQYPCNVDEIKYKYNEETRTCEEKRGCYGYENLTNCQNLCNVHVYDSCSLPVDTGDICDARLTQTRYRHDPTTGECQSFIYKGCGGNANNYETVSDCLRACDPNTTVSVIVIVDEKRTYNLTLPEWVVAKYQLSLNGTSNVEQFVFSRIGKHALDFELIDDVEDDGSRLLIINADSNYVPEEEKERNTFSSEIVCRKQPVTGPCRALFRRWYYDIDLGKCVKFVYGGCRANGNNFVSLTECSRYCNAPFFPSAKELVAEPTDDYGQVIRNPFGKNKGVRNQKGELVYVLATRTGRKTTTVTTPTKTNTYPTESRGNNE